MPGPDAVSCSNAGTYSYPVDSSSGISGAAPASSRRPGMMSMIGFAASPGTDVLPTCSMRTKAPSPHVRTISARSASKRSGQRGS